MLEHQHHPMVPPRDERFPKSVRLVSSKDFDRVFKTGIVVSDSVLVIHACPSELAGIRLGLSISKRVGNSPVRNHWKRLIREAFRRQRIDLPQGIDIVVRPKRGATADYHLVYTSLGKLVKQAKGRLRF